eukprot:m.11071 g.11071  ORF g.11071 m.11071 type:complete len:246 (-) comp4393_c0_seq1:2399-3136(-)
MARKLAVFSVLSFALTAQSTPTRVLDVRSFGARGDGIHNDTGAITDALAAAASSPGSTVLLSAPGTYLSGSLYLVSHTTFRVARGATLLGSALYTDYPFALFPTVVHPSATLPPSTTTASRGRQSLLAGARCTHETATGCDAWGVLTNVTIDGGGVIDGQGEAWWWADDAGSPAAHLRPDMVQPCVFSPPPLYSRHNVESSRFFGRQPVVRYIQTSHHHHRFQLINLANSEPLSTHVHIACSGTL